MKPPSTRIKVWLSDYMPERCEGVLVHTALIMKKLPKTDTDLLDYIQKERVIVIPPPTPGGKWSVCRGDDDRFFQAKNLRDALLSLAHCADLP